MTTLLFVFIVALILALILTPLISKVAHHCGLVHQPTERCVHEKAIPRIGGVALYSSFFLALVLCLPFRTDVSLLLHDNQLVLLFCSATLIFLMGLLDDVRTLPAHVKLLIQVVAATIAWLGGVQINLVSISLSGGFELGWLSLPITIFWIVFVTNAINLIDGLDGLAAGICLFASVVMLFLCIISDRILIALCFASLAGCLLGFLRYNFNPASIFMGDCGSYFIGYIFAVLSVLGSIKGQATLAMLIPFITLGVPLFDTILSPMRRFARGKRMFSPDNNHLHHRLIQGGVTHRNAVLIFYGMTLMLGGTALLLVLIKDERAGLLLLVPSIALFISFKKLGYLNYFAIDKMYGWLRDITESSHISHGSRTFLDHQISIKSTRNIKELWSVAEKAFAFLDLDQARLELKTNDIKRQSSINNFEWVKTNENDSSDRHVFRIEFPLIFRAQTDQDSSGNHNTYLGKLIISKDISSVPIKQFTLRRIEQLKRDLVDKIHELNTIPDKMSN